MGKKKKVIDERKYPCPKCSTGELYDANAGGMFASDIQCTNPTCKFQNLDDFVGCVTS